MDFILIAVGYVLQLEIPALSLQRIAAAAVWPLSLSLLVAASFWVFFVAFAWLALFHTYCFSQQLTIPKISEV